MGVVVQAMHLELDERVALKFLLPEAVESPEAAARFVREARAAVKIKSEHVARVIDVGRLENGAPYMVMEFLEGSDLNALLERGALPIEDADRLRDPGLRRDGRGTRGRHRAPRPQAVELVPFPAHRRLEPDQGARLRHLQGQRARRSGRWPDAHVRVHGVAVLHVARADALGAERRSPERRLVPRRDPVRTFGRDPTFRSADAAGSARGYHDAAARLRSAKSAPTYRSSSSKSSFVRSVKQRESRFQSVGELAGALVLARARAALGTWRRARSSSSPECTPQVPAGLPRTTDGQRCSVVRGPPVCHRDLFRHAARPLLRSAERGRARRRRWFRRNLETFHPAPRARSVIQQGLAPNRLLPRRERPSPSAPDSEWVS